MKKSLILLPLTSFILTACSSGSPAPVVNASRSSGAELSPGVMRPVATNIDASGWQTDIQSAPVAVQTEYTTIPQLNANTPSRTVTQTTPAVNQVVQPTQKVSTPKQVNQQFEIPRDENNAPIYSQIEKGFYNGNTYTVRKGDTMFLIAYIAGKDVNELASLNNMSEPYQLKVGQVLKLGNASTPTSTQTTSTPVVTQPKEPEITYTAGANGTTYASDGNITGPIKAGTQSEPVASTTTPVIKATTATTPAISATAATATPAIKATTASSANNSRAPATNIKWQWPTKGNVIQGFSTAEGGNKGLDIGGSKGQDVYAAAAGKVVYAGNALQGYGNLIIIKHSEEFLSAYAHNDKITVKEQANVKAGQKIATLGSSGTNRNKLHFEIRYKGKSIDPALYLPKR